MSSSTSSSDQLAILEPPPVTASLPATAPAAPTPLPATSTRQRIYRFLRRERTTHAAAVALLLIAATIALRDSQRVGLSHDYHWALKFKWVACADWVLAGDSRAAFGLSPAAMQAEWPATRVLNFAFAAGIYTDDYLDAIEQVLDPASACPTIILAVSPRTLVNPADTPDGDGFARLKRETYERSRFEALLARWFPWTSPIRLDALSRELNPFDTRVPVEVRFPDGWSAQAPPPDQRTIRKNKQLNYYRDLFASASIDPATVDRLLARVQNWSQNGIRVIGFFPPIDPDLQAIENQLSGLRTSEFARRFTNAGGRWLPVEPAQFETHDGSHLYRQAAERLSRDLAVWLSPASPPD